MVEELNEAIGEYRSKWQVVLDSRQDKVFFEALRQTAVGWKVVDMADFDSRFADLRDRCDQIHFGWVDERWLVTLHVKDDALFWGLKVIKLMQRRPGSTDATGLDHVDFLVPKDTDIKSKLQTEQALEWNEEFNGDHCKWISIWFDGTEAKLRKDTVLQVCADEMLDYQRRLFGKV
jgi:hypothetical protein